MDGPNSSLYVSARFHFRRVLLHLFYSSSRVHVVFRRRARGDKTKPERRFYHLDTVCVPTLCGEARVFFMDVSSFHAHDPVAIVRECGVDARRIAHTAHSTAEGTTHTTNERGTQHTSSHRRRLKASVVPSPRSTLCRT